MTLSNDLLERLVITTNSNSFLDWLDRRAREHAPWVFPFGLSCCALEHAAAFPGIGLVMDDSAGPERVRPEEADMMVFGGSINSKLLPTLQALHARLKEPKWVMAVGACASSGGLYAESYGISPGLGSEIPVDVYVPGCPPTPEVLKQGFELMRERMQRNISRWSVQQQLLESRV